MSGATTMVTPGSERILGTKIAHWRKTVPRPKISAKKSPYYSNAVGSAGFTVGAEATNVVTINVQLKDVNGDNLTQRGHVNWFLTTDAAGTTTGAAVSGGVAAGTNGKVNQTVTGIAGWATSDTQGRIDFAITEAGATTRYLVIVLPDGTRNVSTVATWA